MGKKMKLPFLFKNTEPASKSLWQWPSCNQPKTLSFRAATANDDMFKTLNSAYFDVLNTHNECFTNSSESASFSASSEETGGDPVETVIRGLRSERLFFEPDETSSILEVAKAAGGWLPFKESVVLSMESRDPYVDFKKSMVEMVEAHGLKEWECLEELLCWYLRVNGKHNHGYIVGAFVDLLVGLAFASSSSSNSSASAFVISSSPTSPLSFTSSSSTTTPCSSSLQAELVEIEEEEDNGSSLDV
ncbi:hypothetical protein L1049_008300 [Liquidambar formosana]|uniref:Transcription repressor n=1 Tax=Liquidambar formosana TaxID=63359 RepID=A0AAP0SAK0_LIQFO